MKRVLRKLALMYDYGKEYIIKNQYKKDIITRKIDYPIHTVAEIKNSEQKFCLYNKSPNYKTTFHKAYSIYQKTARTNKVFDQIVNHILTRAFA